MNCDTCNKPMMRVKHAETDTETVDTFTCTNKKCPKFGGMDLNNPKYTQEVRKPK